MPEVAVFYGSGRMKRDSQTHLNEEMAMHIARKELRAFPANSPEFIVLRGVKQIRTNSLPSQDSFDQALFELRHTQNAQDKKIRWLVSEIGIIIQKPSARLIHDEIHRLLLQLGFAEPYIRCIDTSVLSPKWKCQELRYFFPCHRDIVYVVTAGTPQGQRVIFC